MGNSQPFSVTVDEDHHKDLASLQRLFQKRRSVRSYIPEKPKREEILEILDCARFAPNSCNLQHYGFIYIDDDSLLKKLEGIATDKVSWAPALIVIIDDRRFSQKRRAGLQSTAAATENVILAATARGLGTCWMAGFVGDDRIRDVLGIPDYYDVTGLMTIGYPNPEVPAPPTKRLQAQDYIHLNGFEKRKRSFYHFSMLIVGR